jgi:hypothetical protein
VDQDLTQPPTPTAPTETTPAPRAPVLSRAATEALWRIYGATNEWIRFADTKACAILAADALLLVTAVLELLKRNATAATAALPAAAVQGASVRAAAHPAVPPGPVGTLGDSFTDEYRFYPSRPLPGTGLGR